MNRTLLVVSAFLLHSVFAFAQLKPEYDMGKTQMVFLTQSPEWKSQGSRVDSTIRGNHHAFVSQLLHKGECALVGEITGKGPLREVLVFKNDSLELIEDVSKRLPAVRAGMYRADVLSWFVARNLINPPDMSGTPEQYVFGILVKGPNWTPDVTEETERIQAEHLANINRLAELGKLVLAGPFYAGGNRRGIFIFKTSSLQEAQELTDTDPAVIAGRLKIELHPTVVPKGILP